jgi:predicted nucleotidyltransferase
MALGNYRKYLKGNVVWIKKYFYVLRPILAMNWKKLFRTTLTKAWKTGLRKGCDGNGQ